MIVTEQNYLKILQGTDITLGQVFRFLQYSKKPSTKVLLKIRSDIRGIIIEETRQNRRKQIEQELKGQQQKKEQEQLKLKERLQKRTRQQSSDD